MEEASSLRDWARRELTVKKSDILWEARDRIARLVGISTDGSVSFRIPAEDLEKLTTRERILLYMVGKLYSEAAGYTDDATVSNSELAQNLGMPDGTVKSQLKVLRDRRYIKAVQAGTHSISADRILDALSSVEAKVEV